MKYIKIIGGIFLFVFVMMIIQFVRENFIISIILLVLAIAGVVAFRKKFPKKQKPQPQPQTTTPQPPRPITTSTPYRTEYNDNYKYMTRDDYHYYYSYVRIYKHDFEDLFELDEDWEVELKPEPTNEYDPNAVAVYSGRIKIGYLYKGTLQKKVLESIAEGYEVDSAIRRVDDGEIYINIGINPI